MGYWPSGLTPISDYCMSETLSHDELRKLFVAILNSLSDTYMLEVYIYTCTACTIKRKHNLGVDATYWVIFAFIMFIDF